MNQLIVREEEGGRASKWVSEWRRWIESDVVVVVFWESRCAPVGERSGCPASRPPPSSGVCHAIGSAAFSSFTHRCQSCGDNTSQKRGSNKIVLADEDFTEIEVRQVGRKTAERGFSSAKFVPGTNEEVVVGDGE